MQFRIEMDEDTHVYSLDRLRSLNGIGCPFSFPIVLQKENGIEKNVDGLFEEMSLLKEENQSLKDKIILLTDSVAVLTERLRMQEEKDEKRLDLSGNIADIVQLLEQDRPGSDPIWKRIDLEHKITERFWRQKVEMEKLREFGDEIVSRLEDVEWGQKRTNDRLVEIETAQRGKKDEIEIPVPPMESLPPQIPVEERLVSEEECRQNSFHEIFGTKRLEKGAEIADDFDFENLRKYMDTIANSGIYGGKKALFKSWTTSLSFTRMKCEFCPDKSSYASPAVFFDHLLSKKHMATMKLKGVSKEAVKCLTNEFIKKYNEHIYNKYRQVPLL
ncbi:hypothetical protein PFISCL1PPCAC_6718 [Pristionchus fissidentatus]|uniref:Uncharacterized protein n=1 Tax=Pristionchus fissidentatus TaxID=1538716 RepID=A0AAV5V706_9BILA|nr:hypothetical protein PFISCL1PPCAC_6718 [Pristionchus fissidentatus]